MGGFLSAISQSKMSQENMMSGQDQEVVSQSQILFDDMPQMPETTGFLEIFQEMMGLNLVNEEWLAMGSLSIWTWIAIISGLLLTLGALVVGGWFYWQNKEEINETIAEGIETAKKQVTGWVRPEEEKKSFTDKVSKWFKQE